MKRPGAWRPFIMAIALLLPPHQAQAGLVVVVPADNATRLCDLSEAGKHLVHGLAVDDATVQKLRREIQAKGLYGIVTVDLLRSSKSLPFADRLLNKLHLSLDEFRSAEMANESLRVLAPGGLLKSFQKGEPLEHINPRPEEMDDWTHFDYDATGSGVSHDRLVAPPTNIQWRSETQEYIGLGGNPAGYRPYTGYRIMNGRAFALYGTGKLGEKNAPAVLIARDAFNGTPLWKLPAYTAGSGTPQEYQFIVGDNRVFTYLEEAGPLVAIDAATGKIALTFDKAAKLPDRNSKLAAGYIMLRYAAGTLIQTDRTRLLALDAKTGEIKWQHEEKDDYLCFPRIEEREGRVYVQAVENAATKIQGRWANLKTKALLCLDLKTGKTLWRSADLNGANFGQSIASWDRIFLFNPGGIGASEKWGKNDPQGSIACLSKADGSLLWTTPKKFVWGYNLLVRDGQPYFADPDSLHAINPKDGTIDPFWKAPYNNRCNRTSATEKWIIMGLGIFVNAEGVANVRSIARSGCAQGAFPANGLTYFTPNICTCFTMLRGHLALSSEAPGAALPDDARLIKGDGIAAEPFAGKPTPLDTPISSEWLVQVNQGAAQTPAVPSTDGKRSYRAIIHEHRIECRAGEQLLWSFTAGGRISQPPLLHADHLYFGSHDGYAYCLNAGNGALIWKFLGGPTERLIVSHGQLESSYPVYNVVLFNNQVCFTAGLHPEVGGGIQAWGLEPATGAIAWHKTFKRTDLIVKPGQKIAPNRVLNSPLTIEENRLAITGLTFDPAEDDAAIQQRIDTSSLGDKLRNTGWTVRGTPAEKR